MQFYSFYFKALRHKSWRGDPRWLCTVALAATLAAPVPALADPPSWAPAHGYRAKHGHPTTTTTVTTTTAPVIALDRCNRELIVGVIGGAAGAAVGSQIGKGDGKIIATATGAIIGVLVGGAIGHAMDEADQSCVGTVLEKAETGQTVAWKDPDGGQYQVTPQRTFKGSDGRPCREYTTAATIGGKTETVYGTACRQPDGSWEKHASQ